MFNKDIRRAITYSGVRYWQVAKRYGCTPSTLSCKLRHELPQEEKSKLLVIIEKLKVEQEQEAQP